MKHVKLVRYANRRFNTLGLLYLEDEFEMYTLELPDKGNTPYVSRIPEGEYLVKWTEKKNGCWHLQDVQGRTGILMHVGNHVYETTGCILLGTGQAGDLIIHSVDALAKLNDLISPDPQFKLTITNLEGD